MRLRLIIELYYSSVGLMYPPKSYNLIGETGMSGTSDWLKNRLS